MRYLAALFEIYVAVQPLPILIAIIAIPQPSALYRQGPSIWTH